MSKSKVKHTMKHGGGGWVDLEIADEMYQALERCRQGISNLVEFDLIDARHIDTAIEEINQIDKVLTKARGEP